MGNIFLEFTSNRLVRVGEDLLHDSPSNRKAQQATSGPYVVNSAEVCQGLLM